MKGQPIYPFLRARDDIKPEPWFHRIINLPGSQFAKTTDLIDAWDENTALEFKRVINVDFDRVKAQCKLHSNDSVKVVATLHCPSTGMRCAGETQSGDDVHTVSVRPPIGEIAGRILLHSRVVLCKLGDGERDMLAAKSEGHIIWSSEIQEVSLEPLTGRFPVVATDFAGVFPSGSPWYLDWDPGDMEVAWDESVCLRVNSEHPCFSILRSKGADAQEAKTAAYVWSVAKHDVGRQLVDGLLDAVARAENEADHSLLGLMELPRGSVGRRLIDLVRAFSLVRGDKGELRSELIRLLAERRNEPQAFSARIQDKFGLLNPLNL